MVRHTPAHRPPRHARLTRSALTGTCALVVAVVSTVAAAPPASAAGLVALASVATCEERTVTTVATADTWIDENSPFATKGGDSVLNVDAGSVNVDTGVASGRTRALVRFPLPGAVPAGCVVGSARLRLYSLEGSAGMKVEVVRLASTWSEGQSSWSNQPATVGEPARIWSRAGDMRWNVTAQVEAMLGANNHGFLVRDAAEGTEAGGGHGFYSREKGEAPPELVITFAAPPSDDPPDDPAPPVPARVSCGEVLTQSTLVTNDLSACPGDGLVVGADRIIVDLDGHTIDGVGLGSGILNDGHDLVTVRNGTLQDFDYGVQLPPETARNTIEQLTLRLNQVAAVELFDVTDSEVTDNTLDQNGGGIVLVSGTRNVVVSGNAVSGNGGAGLLLVDADDNRLEGNTVEGGGDLGIGLERATDNALIGNTVSSNSDGGIEISEASHGNLVEGNTVTESGDHGILVRDSDGLRLLSNVSHRMSDSGITLDTVNDSVVRGNDVRFNTGGLQVDGSSRNLIETNDASSTSGIGIELGGGSFENDIVDNTAVDNGAQGIYVADDATDVSGAPIPGLGNLLRHNDASANLADGIVTAKGGHTLTANTANANSGWGVNAAPGTIDGRGNVARANLKPEQCVGVVCKVEWDPPETAITDGPDDDTTSAAASFAFSSTEPGSFQCRLDGEDSTPWSPCASPRTYTGLAEGAHTFEVRATDLADNTDPSPATATWRIDTTPPQTTITRGPADPTTDTTATLDLSASETGASFECSLDGAAFTTCTSPLEYAGLAPGAHTVQVRATDRAGNTDVTPAIHAWTILSADTTPPQTIIDTRPDDPTTNTTATFAFSADETGATFECSLDGAAFEGCASGVEYAGLSEGSHTFEVRATDTAGNTDPTPATAAWTIDTIAPQTTIDTRPDDPTTNTTATFAFSADETGSTFECSLDGAAFTRCTSGVELADLGTGTHTFEVRATDPAGNTDPTPASYTWTVRAADTTPPQTTIDTGPDDPTTNTTATFAFSADETGATFECSLDGAAFTRCATGVEYANLSEGSHTFEVRATDTAGNTDPSPATASWTIDTIAPQTTSDSQPDDPTTATTAAFAFSADEAGSTFECSLDGAAFTRCASGIEYADLTEGAHTFEVRATDRAGNTDPTPATAAWTIKAPDTTPPQTTIDSRPDDPTTATTAAFTFGSDEAGSTFECSLDGAAFAQCTSGIEYADLTEGSHTFEVRATDPAGNTDPTPATAAWTIDTTAPQTTIDTRPDDPTTDTTAAFTFSADETGSTFECSLDAAEFTSCTSPRQYTGLAEGFHTLRVRATDAAGNIDPTPAIASWTIKAADTTPPQTTIDTGPDDPTTDTTAAFTFSADETGSTFECSLDSAEFTSCTSPRQYTGLAEGAHTLEVRATDTAGNADPTAATAAWTIDTTAPQTTISSAPPAQTTVTTASFVFTADETASTFECSLDGAAFTRCATGVEYADLSVGSHTFEVRATDAAGNSDPTPASYAWTIEAPDTTPPQTTIDTRPDDPTTDTTAAFAFSADEAGATFECSLDSAEFTSCTSPRQYTGLAEGFHTLRVRATDPAGNTDLTPAVASWTIEAPDTTPPQTTIDSRPDDPTTNTTAAFTFSADETGSTFECSLDSAEFTSCTSPREYTGLAEGFHTLRIRATDAAGNTDPSPASASWTIDTTSPQTSISSAPPAQTTVTTASFVFTADETSTFECSLDGAAFARCATGVEYADLSEGSHTFEVRATDPAGNTDPTPASYTWTIEAGDTTPPQTTIDTGPDDPTTSTTAAYAFSADETGSTFECSLDSAEFTSCTSPRQYTGLTEGDHTLRVRATDPAGNTDPTPAIATWTIEAADTTPPQTTIDSRPDDPTTDTTAAFTFSADETGSTFECSLDSAAFTGCTSRVEYADLSEGDHTFEVRATDPAGNTDPTPATYTWTIDTTPPQTTIDTRPDDPTTDTTTAFTFSADETGSTFECSLDSAEFTSCTSPRQYTGLIEGDHTLRVRATDPAGNTDLTPATYTWTVDTTAPQTTVATGPDDPTTDTTATFTFTADETGATFECSLDGAAFTRCTSGVEFADLREGSHTFQVRATDAAGNTDPTPATSSWTIDTTPPQTTIDTRPVDPTASTTAVFAFSAGGTGATFECSLDGAAPTACSSPTRYPDLPEGTHTFEVRATDPAGNTDLTPATYTWTVDTTAPQTTVATGPDDPTTDTTATFTFTFTADETGATFECSLDGAAFTRCTSGVEFADLREGSHTFQVRATDPAGNTDPTPASYTWTVRVADTTPPETTISSAPPAQTTDTTARFTFSADETGATFECSLDGSAFTFCTSPRQYPGLTEGTHTLRVRATDPAGNTDPSPATHTWTVRGPFSCPSPATATAVADAWLDQNSSTTNKGSDSILKTQSKQPADNFRTLVRFDLPAIPPGCVVDSARLRLYAASTSSSQRSLQAFGLGSSWTEGGATWANQPAMRDGSVAMTTSGRGYREWSVAPLVQEMYASGANNGFLIKDADEGQDAEQQFHAREKGENVPQLVLTFAPAP